MLFVSCPVCHAACVVHPGKAPGKGFDYLNRCPHRALTGQPGVGNTYKYRQPTSWRYPARSRSERCGAPLTTPEGEIIRPLDWQLWREIVRRPFDPGVLHLLVYHPEKLRPGDFPEIIQVGVWTSPIQVVGGQALRVKLLRQPGDVEIAR